MNQFQYKAFLSKLSNKPDIDYIISVHNKLNSLTNPIDKAFSFYFFNKALKAKYQNAKEDVKFYFCSTRIQFIRSINLSYSLFFNDERLLSFYKNNQDCLELFIETMQEEGHDYDYMMCLHSTIIEFSNNQNIINAANELLESA